MATLKDLFVLGVTNFVGNVIATGTIKSEGGFIGNLTGNVTGNSTTATTATKVANSSVIKFDAGATEGTDLYTFNGSAAKTIDIKAGTNISLTKTAGTITIANTYTYTHPTTAGNKHIPSGGSSGQFLGWESAGTAKWVDNPNTTYTYFLANTGGTTKATSNVTNPYLILRDDSSNQEIRLVGSTNISVIGENNASTFSFISNTLTNQDLDNYKTLGFHYAGGNNTVTNKPSGIDAFGLSVYQTAGGWFTQEIIEANTNSGRRWQRYCNGSNWTAWIPLPTFTTTPTSGQVVITDGTTGGIKSSGYTIATSVPANAKFTDTDTKVTQNNITNNITANDNYRVLLSYGANDTNETNTVNKSGNLFFNPVSSMLYIKGSNDVSTIIGTSDIDIGTSSNYAQLTMKDFAIHAINDSYHGLVSPFLSIRPNDSNNYLIRIIRNARLHMDTQKSIGNIILIDSSLRLSNTVKTEDNFTNLIQFTIDNQDIYLGNNKSGNGPNYLRMSHSHVYLHSDNITSIKGFHTTLIGADRLRDHGSKSLLYATFTSQLTLTGRNINVITDGHYDIDSHEMHIYNGSKMEISANTFYLDTRSDSHINTNGTINMSSFKTVIDAGYIRLVTNGDFNSSSGFFIGDGYKSTNGIYLNKDSISLRSKISLLRIRSDISIETNKFKIYSTPRHTAHTLNHYDYEQISFYIDANIASMVLSKHAMSRQFIPAVHNQQETSILYTSTISGNSSIAVGDNINVTGDNSIGIGYGSYNRTFEEPNIVPNGVITKITDRAQMTPRTDTMYNYCEFVIPISDEDISYLSNRFGNTSFYILIVNEDIYPDSLVGEQDINKLYNYCKYCRAIIYNNALRIIKVRMNISGGRYNPYKLLNEATNLSIDEVTNLKIWTTPDEFLVRGNNSMGIGENILAKYNDQLVIGKNNVAEDEAFIIGNGSDINSRKNIFTVSRRGTVVAVESITLYGTGYPKGLVFNDGNNETTEGYIRFYSESRPSILYPELEGIPVYAIGKNGQSIHTSNIRVAGGTYVNILDATISSFELNVTNNYFTFANGATIYIKTPSSLTGLSNTPSLKYNSTSEYNDTIDTITSKPIYYKGSQLNTNNTPLLPNTIYELVYDGTNWNIINYIEPVKVEQPTYTFTKNITFNSTEWVDTGINNMSLIQSGSYIIQVSNVNIDSSFNPVIFTGVMSWASSWVAPTNNDDVCEIPLYQSVNDITGNMRSIYLRLIQSKTDSPSYTKLQIALNFTNTSTVNNVTFKFRRLM